MDHTSVEGPHGGVLSNGRDSGDSNILCRAEISFCNFVFVNLQIVFVIFSIVRFSVRSSPIQNPTTELIRKHHGLHGTLLFVGGSSTWVATTGFCKFTNEICKKISDIFDTKVVLARKFLDGVQHQ